VDARRKAQTDARKSLETTLDGVERVGDKIDRAYYDVKSQAESSYNNTKSDIEKEYEKEKTEIGKQVEVCNPQTPEKKNHAMKACVSVAIKNSNVEFDDGGRWYGAFGGFGGLGVVLRI
jgi:hypothetical protein